MPETDRDLDVRTIPPPERHPTIFRRFDALAPGGSFVLVNDHGPKPLLYQIQVERAGRFDWNVLEAGPARWRVEIARRGGDGPRGVTECLETDHRRLEAILDAVEAAVGAGDFRRAGERFSEFTCGLSRHIVMEEEILFPVFEHATGIASGPTQVMRMEHVEIKRLMAEARESIGATDAERFGTCVEALRGVLGEHNVKEEQILYPATDRAAGGDRERDDIVKRMQAV